MTQYAPVPVRDIVADRIIFVFFTTAHQVWGYSPYTRKRIYSRWTELNNHHSTEQLPTIDIQHDENRKYLPMYRDFITIHNIACTYVAMYLPTSTLYGNIISVFLLKNSKPNSYVTL